MVADRHIAGARGIADATTSRSVEVVGAQGAWERGTFTAGHHYHSQMSHNTLLYFTIASDTFARSSEAFRESDGGCPSLVDRGGWEWELAARHTCIYESLHTHLLTMIPPLSHAFSSTLVYREAKRYPTSPALLTPSVNNSVTRCTGTSGRRTRSSFSIHPSSFYNTMYGIQSSRGTDVPAP